MRTHCLYSIQTAISRCFCGFWVGQLRPVCALYYSMISASTVCRTETSNVGKVMLPSSFKHAPGLTLELRFNQLSELGSILQRIYRFCTPRNSADPYHFKTLHAPLPLPFLEKFVTADHTASQDYGKGVACKRTVCQMIWRCRFVCSKTLNLLHTYAC